MSVSENKEKQLVRQYLQMGKFIVQYIDKLKSNKKQLIVINIM